MPRHGITYDQVAVVADSMTAENLTPSAPKVRERLGVGSCNTVHKHLATWRAAQPQLTVTPAELPSNIIKAIFSEIERAKAESRAEIEARLVLIQTELADLVAYAETMETDHDKLMEEHNSLRTERDNLLEQLKEFTAEMNHLKREVELERSSVNEARTELAQIRNKKDTQEEVLTKQAADIEKLESERTAEMQAKILAEKELAVLVATFQAEQEKNKILLMEKNILAVQLDTERQSAEKARIDAAIISNKFEIKSDALVKKTTEFNDMMGLYEVEVNARVNSGTKP